MDYKESVLFLQPVLQEKIWGGQNLHRRFGLDLPSDHVGEAWCISAHPNGVSKVIAPEGLAGLGLDTVYATYPHLFGETDHTKETTFPLLIKILDARDDLSVQVHPDDEYARLHEGPGERGKTECWYVIDAQEGASIIYGHNAPDRETFMAAVEAGDWDHLLRRVPVKAGDFFDVPHGTIHAIGAGIMILETQQSSDTTYRVYDYDRRDDQGHTRDLHLKDSVNVTRFPHVDPVSQVTTQEVPGGQVTHLVSNDFFTVEKWIVQGDFNRDLPGYYSLATVIAGQGEVKVGQAIYPVKAADAFILPYALEAVSLDGDMTLIVSHPA